MIGRVISTKLKDTATVLVSRVAIHPLYKKTFVRSKKYLCDDRLGVKDGDLVEIVDIKPVSKRKHWKITRVLGRSLAEIAEKHLKEKGEEAISEVMPKVSESVEKKTDIPIHRSTETPKKKVKREVKKNGST